LTSATFPDALAIALQSSDGRLLNHYFREVAQAGSFTPAQQQAECAQTSFKISYFKNGQNAFKTVGTPGAGFAALQLVESGVPLVSNSRCLNGVTVSWSVPRAGTTPPPDESRTLSSSGKTIFIRSGVPLAADKGVFVVQARDRTGALSEYDFRVDP